MEQSELSKKNWESNLVHRELVHLPRWSTCWIRIGLYCWEHQFQKEEDGTLRLCPRPAPSRPWSCPCSGSLPKSQWREYSQDRSLLQSTTECLKNSNREVHLQCKCPGARGWIREREVVLEISICAAEWWPNRATERLTRSPSHLCHGWLLMWERRGVWKGYNKTPDQLGQKEVL